jgi:hypothetical protein
MSSYATKTSTGKKMWLNTMLVWVNASTYVLASFQGLSGKLKQSFTEVGKSQGIFSHI